MGSRTSNKCRLSLGSVLRAALNVIIHLIEIARSETAMKVAERINPARLRKRFWVQERVRVRLMLIGGELRCLLGGYTNKVIAHKLRLAEQAVKDHVAPIRHKIGARDCTPSAVCAAH
jgi:DNA-binding NarL/FixJ family response regulator